MHRYYSGRAKHSHNIDGRINRVDHLVIVGYVEHDREQKLPKRSDLIDYSDDFAWGYGGSGPAQLALAILADFTHDDEMAVVWHQTFKWDFIVKLKWLDPFMITGDDIDAWLVGNEVQIKRSMELVSITTG